MHNHLSSVVPDFDIWEKDSRYGTLRRKFFEV